MCRRRQNPVRVTPVLTSNDKHYDDNNAFSEPYFEPIHISRQSPAEYHSAKAITYYPRPQRQGCCARKRELRQQRREERQQVRDQRQQRRQQRQQHCGQTRHQIPKTPAPAYYLDPATNSPVAFYPVQHSSEDKREKDSVIVRAMATILLVGLGLGAQKVVEKRRERKEKKALAQLEHSHQMAGSSTGVIDGGIREGEREERVMRKSEEAAREGEGRRSEERVPAYTEGPPPRYEDAVRGAGQ